MQIIKRSLAVLVMLCVVFANSSIVFASENGLNVQRGKTRVRELTVEEMESLSNEVIASAIGETTDSSSIVRDVSYTPYSYSTSFTFRDGDVTIARADVECIVWRYTDGKVHLYRRTIDVSVLASYSSSRTYGSIVNTDGSYSYTTGDRVMIYDNLFTWNYAIDFWITPSDYDFTCYEV